MAPIVQAGPARSPRPAASPWLGGLNPGAAARRTALSRKRVAPNLNPPSST